MNEIMRSVVSRRYGPHRRPMADPRTDLPAASSPRRRGRPWHDTRAVVNGVLWVLRTGAPWHDLPGRYPPYQTCHRRFQHWQRTGLLRRLLRRLAEDLRDRGKLDLTEAFIDASFSSAKKGALPSVLLAAVKGADHGDLRRPWSSSRRARGQRFARRNHARRRHACAALRPRAPDSPDRRPWVRQRSAHRHLADHFGIELISPNRSNRRTRTQDGRPLRRYRRRWKIERLFAWFHNSRRIVTRWERDPANFLGMIYLASAVILLRAFMR